MTVKDTVQALLDRLPDDCTLDDVQYHLYVVQAIARGEAEEGAGQTVPHEQVDAELRPQVAARTRRVIWTESARGALDEVIAYVSQESSSRAMHALTRALDTAASLSTLAERGRDVREIGEPTLRELPVFDYRMLSRVHADRVVIRAFLHGARDFSTWVREQEPDL